MNNLLLRCAVFGSLSFGMLGVSEMSAQSFTPGTTWTDNTGTHINAHGGCVVFHDGMYYWFGEYREKNASAGISCYKSSDLYNWTKVGLALTPYGSKDDETFQDVAPGRTLERPKVIYNDKTGKWVMWIHWENGADYSKARVAVCTSDEITGPYKLVSTFRPNNHDSRDQTLLKSSDGTAYHFCSTNMNTDINVVKLTDDATLDAPAATGYTALTPNGAKVAIETAKNEITTGIQDSVDSAIDNALTEGGKLDTAIDEAIQDKIDNGEIGGSGTMAYVLTPTITTPDRDATNVSTLPTIVATAYRNVFEDDVRQHRIFQVASDSSFGTLLVNQNVNADSYAVTTQLTPSTKLYCRVRDVAVSGLQSEWSSTVAFTTAAGVVANTPVVTLHGYADSPTDILSGLTITTSEYSVSGGALDAHRATSWVIATKDGTRANVWQSLEDTTNKTSITVPDGTLQKGTAYTLSVTFHGTTSFDSSPAVVEFTTSADFGTVNAPTLTVEGGPNTVYETPTLTGGAFSNTRDPDTHDMTDWEVLDATGATPIWQSLNDTSNKTTIRVAAGELANSTAYKARVRYHGAKYGWSAYTTVDFSTVAAFNVVNTPTITVQGAPSDVKETPVLTGTAFGGINVTHKSTDWKILKADDNAEVWKSEGDTTNLTTIKVPKGILQVSTAYIFQVRYNANEGVSSAWAQTTATCAAEFIRYNYIGVPGTSTFGVGLCTQDIYESIDLKPADNCEVETDFQYGLYVLNKEDTYGTSSQLCLKWIPKFYIAPLQVSYYRPPSGTYDGGNEWRNLNDNELEALLPYVNVTKEQMKEAQRRSPYNAMVIAPSSSFTDESDANSHGFYLMRGFVDGGKTQEGFFIANTLTTTTPSSTFDVDWFYFGVKTQNNSGISLWRAGSSLTYNKFDNNVTSFLSIPTTTNAKGNFIYLLHDSKYQCCSIFAWAVISVLSLIQGQYATDTAQCAWYDSTLIHNYPKGINQSTRDVDDASVTSSTVNASQGSVFVTAGYEKTTHNGSITGITNVNGWLRQFVIGSWGDGSKLLKRSASIYDITYDNVDTSGASFWETHDVSRVSSNWGGTKSSFPDLTGLDKDLFGVYGFGGNASQNSNEFGTDYHGRYGSNSAVVVGDDCNNGSGAGVFSRRNAGWANSYYDQGFRAMAYPHRANIDYDVAPPSGGNSGITTASQLLSLQK